MAHIEKRQNPSGETVYRVRWRQDGHYVGETFQTFDDARRFRGAVDSAGDLWPEGWIPGHGYAPPEASDVPNLGDWARRAINSRPRANDRTRGAYLRQIDAHLSPELQATPLDKITREQMGKWVLDLSANHKPKTVKNIHGMVSSVFNDAVDAGIIGRNPMKGLIASLPAVQKEDPVFLTPAEFSLLLEATPEHYRPFVLFFARTGCRFGEATALTVAQVDPVRKSVRVDRSIKRTAAGQFFVGSTKSRKSRRTVTIDDTLVESLRPLLAGRAPADLVFTTELGKRVSHSNFTNRVWYPIKAKTLAATGKAPRVHDLRHSHASWLIAAGVTLPAIQARLGHESITTTVDLYGHLMPDADRGAADAMSKLLDG